LAETKKPKNILKIEGGKFKNPYQIKEVIPNIYTFQLAFSLDKEDFMLLKKARSGLTKWAHGIFGSTILLSIEIIARIITKGISDVKTWEIVSIVIGVIIAGILLLLDKLLPSEKKNFIKEIEKYFKENEKSLGVFTNNE